MTALKILAATLLGGLAAFIGMALYMAWMDYRADYSEEEQSQ